MSTSKPQAVEMSIQPLPLPPPPPVSSFVSTASSASDSSSDHSSPPPSPSTAPSSSPPSPHVRVFGRTSKPPNSTSQSPHSSSYPRNQNLSSDKAKKDVNKTDQTDHVIIPIDHSLNQSQSQCHSQTKNLQELSEDDFEFDRITFSIPAGSQLKDRIVIWAYIPNKIKLNQSLMKKNTTDSLNNCSGSVIMANGLALPRSAGLPHIAIRFAKAGFNVFLFDFRHLGDSTGVPRQLVSMELQLEDYLNVLNFVISTETHSTLFNGLINPNKVVLWGWSNSGAHVTKLATHAKFKNYVINQPKQNELRTMGDDHKAEKEKEIKVVLSGVICLDPLCDGMMNFKHHLWRNPLGLAKIGHRVLGDLIISKIPFLNKRFSLNVRALGPGGFLGSPEAERGAEMMKPPEEECDDTLRRRSKLTNLRVMEETGPEFVNLVTARYGYDVMFQDSKGDRVNCPMLVSWSKDQADGLITDQVPRSFLNHCQNILKCQEQRQNQNQEQERETPNDLSSCSPSSNTPIFIQSFEHDGDHFGLHFGGQGFEDGIKRQIDFLKLVL